MTRMAWVLAAFGVIFGGAIIGAIGYDVWAASTGHETISRWIVSEYIVNPQIALPIVAGFSFFFGLVCGTFIGHFFLYQKVPK
jgi:hypothetical protein